MEYLGKQAIVVGAGMSGLLSARVLADYFENVTVVERDSLPTSSQLRKGVPQATQVHNLSMGGLKAMARLFPELHGNLVGAGSVEVDLCENILSFRAGTYRPRFKSGIKTLCQSRDYLEWNIRSLVKKIDNIHWLEECFSIRPAFDAQFQRVLGTVVRRKNTTEEETLYGDIVVDATGKSSMIQHWLESVGFPPPEETTMKINAGYASRFYERKASDFEENIRFLTVFPTFPISKRAGMIAPVEGGRWIVSLAGLLEDYPPGDEEGFQAFAKSLDSPQIYHALLRLKPVSDIVTFKFSSSLRRHFERLPKFPEGLLVIGDGLCRFNPIYGQGMAVCAIEAVGLHECLEQLRKRRAGLKRLFPIFMKKAKRIIDHAWALSAGEDALYLGIPPKKTLFSPLRNTYLGALREAIKTDREVLKAQLKVIHFDADLVSLFRPAIAARVGKSILLKKVAHVFRPLFALLNKD